MIRYIALLRGINVGGKNKITMQDLRSCLTEFGCSEVETYIQSGNVLFLSKETDEIVLQHDLEVLLSNTFDYRAKLVVLRTADFKSTIHAKPIGFGENALEYKYDVLFPRPPLTAEALMQDILPTPNVDTLHLGSKAVFSCRLASRSNESFLEKINAKSYGREVTIRNWNTTQHLYKRCLSSDERFADVAPDK